MAKVVIDGFKNTAATARTDDELKQIAKDISTNLIFTDRHIPSESRSQMLPMVFMPLAIGGKAIDDMIENKVDTIYEYYSKAMPRSINGYPMFPSLCILGEEDAKVMWDHYKKIQKALKAVE
jgi:hypothetical protein